MARVLTEKSTPLSEFKCPHQGSDPAEDHVVTKVGEFEYSCTHGGSAITFLWQDQTHWYVAPDALAENLPE